MYNSRLSTIRTNPVLGLWSKVCSMFCQVLTTTTTTATNQVNWNQKGKTNLDLLEQEIVNGSGISWAICKSAP